MSGQQSAISGQTSAVSDQQLDVRRRNDATTVTNNIFVLAQNQLDAALNAFHVAKARYWIERTDENLEAMEAARVAYLRVEVQVRDLLKVK